MRFSAWFFCWDKFVNDLVGSMNLVRIIDSKSVLSAIGNVLSELFKKNTIFENYRLHYLPAIIKL